MLLLCYNLVLFIISHWVCKIDMTLIILLIFLSVTSWWFGIILLIIHSSILQFGFSYLKRVIGFYIFPAILWLKWFLVVTFLDIFSLNFEFEVARVLKQIISCISGLLYKLGNFHHILKVSLFFGNWFFTHHISIWSRYTSRGFLHKLLLSSRPSQFLSMTVNLIGIVLSQILRIRLIHSTKLIRLLLIVIILTLIIVLAIVSTDIEIIVITWWTKHLEIFQSAILDHTLVVVASLTILTLI